MEESNVPRKIALFGGSFDPVTASHVLIVENLCKNFDKVIILPCYVSPFKTENNILSSAKRIKMLEKVFGENEKIKISKWEIKREECSYSFLTAQHFAQKYPTDHLYFVIGSDGLNTLGKWKNIKAMSSQVTFYVIARPFFKISNAVIKRLAARGIHVEVANFEGQGGSSSEAKVANAFGLLNEVVPKPVAKYIQKKELYNDYAQITAAYSIFHLKSERVLHTYRVAKTGIALAKIHQVNIDKAIKAILLHDIGKYADVKLLRQLSIQVPQEVYELPQPIQHAAIGAEIAKQYFMVQDNEIISAIAFHTTGEVNMTPLQMLVFLADAVEDGRDYPKLSQMRKIVFSNLEKGMAAVLEDTIHYLQARGEHVYFKTVEAYNYYNELINKNKKKKAVPSAQKENRMPTKKKIEKEDVIAGSEQKTPAKKKSTAKSKADSVKTEVLSAKRVSTKTENNLSIADDIKKFAQSIATFLDEKKAKDIVIIDLCGKTIIADYFVIAGATSTTAVKALSEYVDEKLSKDHKIEPLRRDIDSNWAAVDYGSVIVHVMLEETREFYQLERLWDNGDNIEHFSAK